MALPSTLPIEDTYQSEIISGGHGERYQKDLALAIFVRASRKQSDFRMGYEMAIADKFDDVTFFNKATNEWYLIQTKHADKSKGKSQSLKFESLVPSDSQERDKGDFSLFKYLKSYMNVQVNIRGRKHVVIFTNREILDFDQSADIEYRPVDEILRFSEARPIGMKVNSSLIKAMVEYVNKDFKLLSASIAKLFNEGIIDQTIKNFQTPLANILTEIDGKVKFSAELSIEAKKLLKGVVDIQTAELPLAKYKSLATGKSRQKVFPRSIKKKTVRMFFQDLVIYTKQPDDLSTFIDQDLRLWMREWIRPDYFMRLEETQLKMAGVNLEIFFNKKREQVTRGINGSFMHKFLQCSDGNDFFESVKKDLEVQIQNLSYFNSNDTHKCYISRRIEYMEVVEKANGFSDSDSKSRIKDDKFVRELDEKFGDQRFLLLTAEPGMGKSTFLKYIALGVQQKRDDNVYLFYLNRFHHELYNKATSSFEELLSVLGAALSEVNYKELQDIRSKENNPKRYFMIFDAFDEVYPQNRMKVLKLFSGLLHIPNVRILVSARTTIETLVKNCDEEFKVRPIRLVPFDDQDRQNFLCQFWKVNNDSSIHKSEDDMFKKFHSNINRTFCKFTGLPFMLNMLTKVYDYFEKQLNSEQINLENVLPDEKISTSNVYKQFMIECFDKKLKKKSLNIRRFIDEEHKCLLKYFALEHQLLAIKNLRLEELQAVFEDEEQEHLEEFEIRIIKGTERSVLVRGSDEDSRIIDILFAELLVAQFLLTNIKRYEANIFSKNMFFDEYPMIKMLFFTMVEDQNNNKHMKILEKHFKNNVNIVLWACEAGCLKIVEFLLHTNILHTNINPNIIIKLLIVAAQHNCFKIWVFLFQNYHCKVNEADDRKDIVKIFNNHVDIVNAQDKKGMTALHKACQSGKNDVVEKLLRHFANIGLKDRNGFTPLHFAALNGHFNVVETLIKYSEAINLRIEHIKSSDHITTDEKHTIISKMHFDINAQNNDGSTSLHLAALNGHQDVVSILINDCGDVNVKNIEGKKALDLALQNGHKNMVKLFNGYSFVNGTHNSSRLTFQEDL